MLEEAKPDTNRTIVFFFQDKSCDMQIMKKMMSYLDELRDVT